MAMIKLPDQNGVERHINPDWISGTSLKPLGDGEWKLRLLIGDDVENFEDSTGTEDEMRALQSQITGESLEDQRAKLDTLIDEAQDMLLREMQRAGSAIDRALMQPEAERAEPTGYSLREVYNAGRSMSDAELEQNPRGTPQHSALLEAKILAARQAGIDAERAIHAEKFAAENRDS